MRDIEEYIAPLLMVGALIAIFGFSNAGAAVILALLGMLAYAVVK